MKKFLYLFFALTSIGITSCKKYKSGTCHCHYYSGDKRDYDLSSLPKTQQVDSCNVLDSYASAFAGDCDLK